jgi:ribosomal-protein-serine acetyltransferase
MEELAFPDFNGLTFDVDDEVHLRHVTMDDGQAIYDLVHKNLDHLKFMHWMTPDYSMEMAEDFIKRNMTAVEGGEAFSMGIFRLDRLIGSIGFVHFNCTSRRTEIGYWIDRDEEGKGVISNSVRALINYAFDQLNMNKVEIHCSAQNTRSSAVPKRLGFKQEAHLRQQEMRLGQLHDFLIFGLLRSEWANA